MLMGDVHECMNFRTCPILTLVNMRIEFLSQNFELQQKKRIDIDHIRTQYNFGKDNVTYSVWTKLELPSESCCLRTSQSDWQTEAKSTPNVLKRTSSTDT